MIWKKGLTYLPASFRVNNIIQISRWCSVSLFYTEAEKSLFCQMVFLTNGTKISKINVAEHHPEISIHVVCLIMDYPQCKQNQAWASDGQKGISDETL